MIQALAQGLLKRAALFVAREFAKAFISASAESAGTKIGEALGRRICHGLDSTWCEHDSDKTDDKVEDPTP